MQLSFDPLQILNSAMSSAAQIPVTASSPAAQTLPIDTADGAPTPSGPSSPPPVLTFPVSAPAWAKENTSLTLSDSSEAKMTRWAQGCQAIFAGFVVSAHLQHLSPTIANFGGTAQMEMIRSTLECIQDEMDNRRDEGKGNGTGDGAVAAVSASAPQSDFAGRSESAGVGAVETAQEGTRALETLHAVLSRPDNRYTRAISPPIPGAIRPTQLQLRVQAEEARSVPAPEPEERAQAQVQVHAQAPTWPEQGEGGDGARVKVSEMEEGAGIRILEQEWKLTGKGPGAGAKVFDVRQDGRIAPPHQGAAKWWNM